MGAEVHDTRACEVSLPEARAELERILSDPRFHATERQRAILRYLAERRFAGCEEGVKAYSIALDVLGRASNFDASNDPIVRIEVSRLRSSVENYYEAFGAERDVTIHIPKGTYVTLFPRSHVPYEQDEEKLALESDLPETPDDVPVSQVAESSVAASPSGRPLAIYASGALLLCVAIVAGAVAYASKPSLTVRPSVALSMDAVDSRLQGEASQTRDMLLTALTQFQTLTVAKAGHAGKQTQKVAGRAYEIDMKYYGDGDIRSVWWQIVDSQSGDLLKSGLEKIAIDGRSPAATRQEIVDVLARRFAATRGAINNIETHASSTESIGNACVLRAEYQLDDGSSDNMAAVRSCLERTLAADPSNSDAKALFARVLIAPEAAAGDAAVRARALDLANRAVSLAPMSDRAYVALMMTQFADGRIDAALQAGNRAISLNPSNPDAAAKLASVLFSAGYFDAGVAMAQDAGRAVDIVPRDAMLVLALDAYRRGDWSEASLLAEQVNCTDFVVRALRVAALGQLGSDQAKERLADVRGRDPDFERTLRWKLEARRFQPLLSAEIVAGLTKAGAVFALNDVTGAVNP
jgi:tetratricopeptide (TPR) repeat protein